MTPDGSYSTGTTSEWKLVCIKCYYKSDDPAYDSPFIMKGTKRNRYRLFLSARKFYMSKYKEELAKVERSWTQLSLNLKASVFGTAKAERQILEDFGIVWANESEAKLCEICHNLFGKVLNRKVHCRLCGRVFCSNCTNYKVELGPSPGNPYAPEEQKCSVIADVRCYRLVARKERTLQNKMILKKDLDNPLFVHFIEFRKIERIFDENVVRFSHSISAEMPSDHLADITDILRKCLERLEAALLDLARMSKSETNSFQTRRIASNIVGTYAKRLDERKKVYLNDIRKKISSLENIE